MANIFNVTVDDTAYTVNVTVSDGVITTSGGGVYIDGFSVKKGTLNVAGTIEVGDYINGWLGDVYLAGKVLVIPVNDVSDVDMAIQGEII